jgi:hypothetical protein
VIFNTVITPEQDANLRRRERLKEWSQDPWEFLIGKDTDDRPILWTKDEGDEENPYKPFPDDKPHIVRLIRDLFGKEKIVLVDKSRQMMVSTTCCLLLLHHIMFRKGRKVMISKQKEDQAWMLMQDKITGTYHRMPQWMQDAFQLRFMRKPPTIACAATDSMILGVAQNAAASEFRGNQASILLIDEAAFQEEFGEMLRAAKPMAARVWGVTTANTGNPGAETFSKLKEER